MGLAAGYVSENLRLWKDEGLDFLLFENIPKPEISTQVGPDVPQNRQKIKAQHSPASPVTESKQSQQEKKVVVHEPFYSHLHKQPIPAYSLWTYWEFPLDLGSQANTARKALWTSIYKALRERQGWNKQSIAFWTLSRDSQQGLVPDLNLFKIGLQRLSPVYIFCFGRKAFKALFPEKEYAFKRYLLPGGFGVQVFPGPEEMLPDNREKKSLTWKILQTYKPQ